MGGEERAETGCVGAENAGCEFDFGPGDDGLEGVGYVGVAYADPGYDAEEAYEADYTRAVWTEDISFCRGC